MAERLSRADAASLHLHLWLTALNQTLRAAVRQRTSRIEALGRTAGPVGTLAPRHAEMILDGIETPNRDGAAPLPEIALTRREADAEADILGHGPLPPPLERLTLDAGLTAFERAALLITVAPEVASDYRRLYGFVVDDLTRGYLIAAATTEGGAS